MRVRRKGEVKKENGRNDIMEKVKERSKFRKKLLKVWYLENDIHYN